MAYQKYVLLHWRLLNVAIMISYTFLFLSISGYALCTPIVVPRNNSQKVTEIRPVSVDNDLFEGASSNLESQVVLPPPQRSSNLDVLPNNGIPKSSLPVINPLDTDSDASVQILSKFINVPIVNRHTSRVEENFIVPIVVPIVKMSPINIRNKFPVYQYPCLNGQNCQVRHASQRPVFSQNVPIAPSQPFALDIPQVQANPVPTTTVSPAIPPSPLPPTTQVPVPNQPSSVPETPIASTISPVTTEIPPVSSLVPVAAVVPVEAVSPVPLVPSTGTPVVHNPETSAINLNEQSSGNQSNKLPLALAVLPEQTVSPETLTPSTEHPVTHISDSSASPIANLNEQSSGGGGGGGGGSENQNNGLHIQAPLGLGSLTINNQGTQLNLGALGMNTKYSLGR